VSWRDGTVRTFYTPIEDEQSAAWAIAFAADDSRVVKVTELARLPMEGDDAWGGASWFVTDITCCRGASSYPPFWYSFKHQKAAPEPPEQLPEQQVAPTKKGKRKCRA